MVMIIMLLMIAMSKVAEVMRLIYFDDGMVIMLLMTAMSIVAEVMRLKYFDDGNDNNGVDDCDEYGGRGDEVEIF